MLLIRPGRLDLRKTLCTLHFIVVDTLRAAKMACQVKSTGYIEVEELHAMVVSIMYIRPADYTLYAIKLIPLTSSEFFD